MPDIAQIAEALRADECILLLGPRAATFEGEHLQDLLALRFAETLGAPAATAAELPQLARRLAATCKDYTEALEKTGTVLRKFYEEFQNEKIPLYDLAAQLPFKYVLNCTPDSLFLNTLRRQDKNALFFDFHFNKPEYNQKANKSAWDIEQEIAEDRPLVYNLLGHYNDPSSLVLTDAEIRRHLAQSACCERNRAAPASTTRSATIPCRNR
ncbi:MAG: hypothetical protein KF852_08180 [Saprospiraceae bacterium]|nr:hypothetical protein [Saprospiraceae bacterium]